MVGSPLCGWRGPLCMDAGVPSSLNGGVPSAPDGGVSSALDGWVPSAWMVESPLPWVVGGPLPRIAGLSAGGRAPLPEGEGTPRAHSCQGGRCNPAPPHPGVTEAASGPAAPSRQTCPFHPQREGLCSRDSVLMDSPSDDKPAPLAWKLPSPSV